MSDIAKKIDTMEQKLQLGSFSIYSLFWADDLGLFAEKKKYLQRLLKTLEEYCEENELTINTKKWMHDIEQNWRLMRRVFSFMVSN